MGANAIGPNYILDKTFTLAAGNTITGYQVVKGSAAGTCAMATNDASPYVGVAQLDPNEGVTLVAGDTVRVRMLGLTKIQAGAAIGIYATLSCIGLGLVDDANPGSAGDYYIGTSLEAATQLGDIITADLSNKNSQYFAS